MITKPYPWLATVGLLPRSITHSLALLGTAELAGSASNPIIMAWKKELVLAGVKGLEGFSDDAVPWCGLMQAITTLRAGKRPIDTPLWAMNWRGYGVLVADNAGTTAAPKLRFAPGMKASLGDTLVFQRKVAGGFAGHVGRYVAEDEQAFHVVGGNQSDCVTLARVEKARCIAVRRDVMTVAPASVRPFHVAAAGALSKNEA